MIPVPRKSVSSGATGTAYAAAYSTVTNQVSSGISPTPTYDANGNQTTSTPATLTWNALNQPITVNSTTATYDALGRMVEKGLSGTYTQFVFRPSGAILAVYSSSGLIKGTIPLPGGSAAIYNASGLNYIRHTDWLGSSRLATTWAHAVFSKEAYAPFGETYNEAGTPDRSFTGQDQDILTGAGGNGVYDFLFRKYDPAAGRWLSPDPSGWQAASLRHPQSLNRYAYVQNNPLSLTDPSGLSCVWLTTGGVSVGADGPSGSWGDDGDGLGCAAAGVAPGGKIVNPWTVNVNGNDPDDCTSDDPDSGACQMYNAQIAGLIPLLVLPGFDSNNQNLNNFISNQFYKQLDKWASKAIPASPWKTVSGRVKCIQNYVTDVGKELQQHFPNVGNSQAGANFESCMQGVVQEQSNPLQAF